MTGLQSGAGKHEDHHQFKRTWMFSLQRAVMLAIFEPVTPGALRRSMDCRIPSRSATQDDMTREPRSLVPHDEPLFRETSFQATSILRSSSSRSRRIDLLAKEKVG